MIESTPKTYMLCCAPGYCRLSPCDLKIGIHVALFHMLLTADTRSFKDSLSRCYVRSSHA